MEETKVEEVETVESVEDTAYKLYHSKAWNPSEDMLVKAYLAGAEPREKRIAELEAQIEEMKCCGNCAKYNTVLSFCQLRLTEKFYAVLPFSK